MNAAPVNGVLSEIVTVGIAVLPVASVVIAESCQLFTTYLKNAPLQDQVTAISFCDHTYTVKTADGKVSKIWEFNLRFKTDSSELGPRPGEPVIVGAGMQGDRASIVFASPGEISALIRAECPQQK